jgi:hypothetical protein
MPERLLAFGTGSVVRYFRSRGGSAYVTSVPQLHHKS